MKVSKGRSISSTKKVLSVLTKEQKNNVKIITSDAWPAYTNESQNQLVNASLALDKFHILQHLNKAVNNIRKKEHKTLILQNDCTLKNTRFLFLKNQENLSKKQLMILKKTHLKTVKAYLLKEEFRTLYNMTSIKQAKRFIQAWCQKAQDLNDLNLQKFINLVLKHIKGIINSVILKANNAIAEGFNSVVQLIKYSAKGIKSFKSFRIRILFFCRYHKILV